MGGSDKGITIIGIVGRRHILRNTVVEDFPKVPLKTHENFIKYMVHQFGKQCSPNLKKWILTWFSK